MAVPNIFANVTTSIPLSQLDNNFATPITLGNASLYLGNTTTSVGNLTLTNVTISSGNITGTTITLANGSVTNAMLANSTATLGNTTITLGSTTSNVGNLTLTNATVNSLSAPLAESSGGTGTTTGYYGFKNRIINGAMVIDQRNAGAAITVNSNTGTQFGVDRFLVQGTTSAGVFTAQQSTSTPPSGFTNFLRITTTTASASPASGELYAASQIIEGFNIADLGFGAAGASTVTFSFWIRSSLTGTFSGSLKNGNSFNRSYPFTYTINAANTWEYKTVTVAGDTTGTWQTGNLGGLIVYWDLGCGSSLLSTANSWQAGNFNGVTGSTRLISTLNATLDITGVQLEKGSTATSFDYRPYTTELQLCQRYFEKSFPQATAPAQNSGEKAALLYVNSSDGGSLAGFTPFKVTKRASPTIVGYNPSAANSNFSNNGTATFHVVDDTGLGGYTTTLTGARATINWTASAEL